MVEELYKWILLYEGHSKYDNVFGCNLDNVYINFYTRKRKDVFLISYSWKEASRLTIMNLTKTIILEISLNEMSYEYFLFSRNRR